MMMQLESRAVLCEDIGRQYMTYGFRHSSADLCAQIETVTTQDILRISQKMLSTPPSVGCVGPNLSQVPKYELIESFSKKIKDSYQFKHSSILR